MLNFFQRNQTMPEREFALGIRRKGLKTLKNKRARLRERVAFAANESIRKSNKKLLQAVEDEIRRREA